MADGPTLMQYVKRLLDKIQAQEKYAAPFEKRYSNEYVLPFLQKEYAEVYPGLIIASADGRTVDTLINGTLSQLAVPKSGTAGIVVDALGERMMLGGIAAADSPDATKKLQMAWEGNDLDVMHHEAHREALIAARSFGSVAREAGSGGRAVVGIEHASQAAVIRRQSAPYDVIAYAKIWTDEWTGKNAGLLRVPGKDYALAEGDDVRKDPAGSDVTSRWYVADEGTDTKLDFVPVVEFAPRSRLLKDPISEIDPITTQVDTVDLVEGLMVFAGHFGVVPIRWATGLEVKRDPKDPSKPLLGPDGKPAIGFNPRADHLWASSSKDTKFGQLEPAGLASFVTWAEHAAAKVRAKTALASTYFSLDLKSHMSAELLKTDEAPMTRRVRRMGQFGSLNQSWRRLGQYILAIEDPSVKTRIKPIWEDPETRIESQSVDQFQKLTAAGLGIAETAEKVLGWDPETIQRAVAEAEAMRQKIRQEKREDTLSPMERATREFLNAA